MNAAPRQGGCPGASIQSSAEAFNGCCYMESDGRRTPGILLVVRSVALGALAAVAVAATSVATASTTAKPALRLTRGTDAIVVHGSGFYAGERVLVKLVATTTRTQTVRTRVVGTFAARFGGASVNACDAVFVQAVGRRGDRAVLKIFPRACLPADSP